MQRTSSQNERIRFFRVVCFVRTPWRSFLSTNFSKLSSQRTRKVGKFLKEIARQQAQLIDDEKARKAAKSWNSFIDRPVEDVPISSDSDSEKEGNDCIFQPHQAESTEEEEILLLEEKLFCLKLPQMRTSALMSLQQKCREILTSRGFAGWITF